MEITVIVLLVLILIFLVILFLKKPSASPQNDQLLAIKEAEHLRNLSYLKEEKQKIEDELNDLRLTYMEQRSQLVKAEQLLTLEQQKHQEQQEYFQNLQRQSRLEFEQVASRLLEEKSLQFTEQNKVNLQHILSPLRENIKAFEDKVEKVYKSESDERNTLKGVISELMLQSKQIQEDANNLSRALKGDNKKQGNWGEVILEKVLERSGLVKDREYRTQASYTDEQGTRLQPDVILELPDHKHLIIDAKVSLVAYEKLVCAETDVDRENCLKQHILSIKTHVQGLSSKNYQDLYQINSPDFVLLFIPIESSFALAVQQDAELFSYAWERKVVIVSPTTLLATLRTVASLWKQEHQNRNVLEIARLGGSLYDKFVGFLSDMEAIGRHMSLGRDAYDKALNKLSTGAGNLAGTAEKIKRLGAKTNKQIDRKFLDPAWTEEEEL